MDFWLNTSISLAVGAAFSALFNFILGIRKQKDQNSLEVNKQASQIYESIISGLRKDIENQEKDYISLNKMNLDCRERCAGVVVENKFLAQENTLLKTENANLRKSLGNKPTTF